MICNLLTKRIVYHFRNFDDSKVLLMSEMLLTRTENDLSGVTGVTKKKY